MKKENSFKKVGKYTVIICIHFTESTRFWKFRMLLCPRQLFHFLLRRNYHHTGGPHAYAQHPPGPVPSLVLSRHWTFHLLSTCCRRPYVLACCLLPPALPSLAGSHRAGSGPWVRFADQHPKRSDTAGSGGECGQVNAWGLRGWGARRERTRCWDRRGAVDGPCHSVAHQSLNSILSSIQIIADSENPEWPRVFRVRQRPHFSG